eukprot:IDg17725t1
MREGDLPYAPFDHGSLTPLLKMRRLSEIIDYRTVVILGDVVPFEYLCSVYLERFFSNSLLARKLLQGCTLLDYCDSWFFHMTVYLRYIIDMRRVFDLHRGPDCAYKSFSADTALLFIGVNLRQHFRLIAWVRYRIDGDNDHQRPVRYANAESESG